MKKTVNVLLKIRDVFEIFIPCITFCVMLFFFVLQIFFRYILNNPLSWTTELCSMTFTWTVLFGACYAMRMKGHVSFTMLYDKYPPKVKAVAGLAGELLMLTCFAVAIIPTAKYVNFMSMSKSSVLEINMKYVYAPYMVFLVMNVFYMFLDVVRDFKALLGGTAAMEQMLHDTQEEWKTVIEEAEAAEAERLNNEKGGKK